MRFLFRNVMHDRLVWAVFGLLLTAALAVGCFMNAQIRANEGKTIALEMSWKRGDDHYGPNFVHLESVCVSNSQPGCFCSVDFKVTASKDFADYIESFGNNKVPVKYHVDYDRNHRIVGAILESVGTWPAALFHVNERSLSTGFRTIPGQPKTGGHIRNPGDCFPNPTN
jgi:hypothetical protein